MPDSDPFLWRKRRSILSFAVAACMMVTSEWFSVNRMWLQPGAHPYPEALRYIVLLAQTSPFVLALLLRLQIGRWAISGDVNPNAAWKIDTDLIAILIGAYVSIVMIILVT